MKHFAVIVLLINDHQIHQSTDIKIHLTLVLER